MTDRGKPAPEPSLLAPGRGGRWLYPLLLALETVGAVLLYSEGLPIYRKILADPGAYDPQTTFVALGGAVLIQVAYWARYRMRPPEPRLANVLLAHILLFVSRLIFVLPAAIFSFLFIAKAVDVRMPLSRYAFILFALFSLFCYVLELELLGARILRPKER